MTGGRGGFRGIEASREMKVFVLKEEIGWPAIFSSGLLCDGCCQRGRLRHKDTRGLYEAAR